MQDSDKQKTNIFYEIISSPLFGIIGTITSIISIPLAVYFYYNSITHRDLVCVVHPAKAIIVKTGQSSHLSVLFDGKAIVSDVTAAQVAFWNEGNTSIRKENILQTISLVTSPSVRILEATIRKKSREIIQIDLDSNHAEQGRLDISWNILEQGDGAILQIVFAGLPSTHISMNGVIEGQQQIRNIEPVYNKYEADEYGNNNGSIVFAALGSGILGIFLLGRYSYFAYKLKFGFNIYLMFCLLPLFFISTSIFIWVKIRQILPPFGF